VTGPELHTRRLLLRPWRTEDAPRLQAICADPLIHHFTGIRPPYPLTAAVAFIDETKAGWAAGSRAAFAVVSAESGDVVGSISLGGLGREAGIAHVGFLAAAEHRGHGYAPEAPVRCCDPRVPWAPNAVAPERRDQGV
jgi:RimJ/RimL family protein N-acetyltransferase